MSDKIVDVCPRMANSHMCPRDCQPPASPVEPAPTLAQWLHMKMSAAQNLPYNDGDTCPECDEAVRTELLPLLAPVATEETGRESFRDSESARRCVKCGKTNLHPAYHIHRGRCFYSQSARRDDEHLHYNCVCGYDWVEDVLAAQPVGTPEQVRELIAKWRVTGENCKLSFGAVAYHDCANELEAALNAAPQGQPTGEGNDAT